MTLVELLVATSLGGMVMAGILTVVLFIGRSNANTGNYIDMEAQARGSLERFAQDARQASDISWVSNAEINLIVNSSTITYGYDSGSDTFYRTASGVRNDLVSGISSFQFIGYKLDGTTVDLSNLVQASINTKQIQLSLKAIRQSRTAAGVSNTVLSARYILRNKRNTS